MNRHPTTETALYIRGMHGFGDCIHQRAPLRYFLRNYKEVWLESSSVALYWDLIRFHGLKVVNKDSSLRTQRKNAIRELNDFYSGNPDTEITGPRIDIQAWYRAKDVKHLGSVLAAMCESLGVPFDDSIDFRLPIYPEWRDKLVGRGLLNANVRRKPILIYRPLVVRKEWGGCNARNPDLHTYAELFNTIRERFFVVSIADTEPGKEWIVDPPGIFRKADLEIHFGQLPMAELAALFAQAAMVFSSPGFAVPMAQSVGTPVVCVFGGYENSASFSAGSKWAPYLGIDPINSCQCFLHTHPCDKRIDIPLATQNLTRFVNNVTGRNPARAAYDQVFT